MKKDIEQAITDQLTKQTKTPEQVVSLNIDNICKATHLKGLDAFVNLKSLSLCDLGLTSLEGFPKLPNLVKLTLSDNRITGGLQHLVDAGLTSLSVLELANNRIATVEELAPLKQLKSLKRLDLDQCPLTKQGDYKAKVFKMLDELKYLDSVDREGRERDGDEEEEDFEEEDAGEKEYAVLVGPEAVGEDEEGDYVHEEGEDDDEGEEEDEGAAQAAGGTKRKREEEEEAGEEDE